MALKRDVTYSGRFNAASTERPQGGFKNRTSPTSEDGSYLEQQWLNDWDGLMSSLLSENGIVPNGLVDKVGASQYFEGMLRLREVSPRNNDWNGYLDPAHTVPIQKVNTSAGTRSFPADTEIAPNLYVSAATNATFSTTGMSWLAGNSLYKLFDYTAEQLADIDVTKVPIYIKDQAGVEYFLKHNGTSVIVTKVGSQLKVTITFSIFAELGITKLWRFFVTERVGRVVELDVEGLISAIYPYLKLNIGETDITSGKAFGLLETNTKEYPVIISAAARPSANNRNSIVTVTLGSGLSKSFYAGSPTASDILVTARVEIEVLSGDTYTISGTDLLLQVTERPA